MNGDVSFQNVQSCLTMAAGTDPQPIESPVVPVCGKSTSISLARVSGVRNNIPYSDHNYGKPLTPPDSCSPEHPEEADTGNEDEGFTRCICGFKHDDGYMICCDRCSAWQHVECVGIKSNCVPDTYLCDMCDPRPLDKKRAILIQTKKREEPTDEEDDEDSDRDSDNTISRAVSLPNSTAAKEIILTKGKRKKKESTRKLNQKEMKHNKRKRRKRKHISTDTIPVDEETNGPWNIPSFPNHQRYEEAHKTVYIGELENRSFPLVESNAKINNFLNPEQICKVVDVQKNKKGVVVTEDIDGQQFIIECKGSLMLESKFKEDHPMFSKCDPFVLYYTKLQLVMNFSAYGNDARFIRRSCTPTAEVLHVTVENKPQLIVVSITPLAKGTEVTLAFEFPFEEYRRQLDCACAQDNCKVLKHNMAIQRVEQTNGYRSSKDEHGLVDSSLSNHMDSDSDNDNNATKDKRNKRKLSREDRKLQQYLRQFEKMEKTEKKKQQSNGRDGRTGIVTQRNYPDECNGETPTKPIKALRKQGLSQRQQRKMQAIRRAHRLPSCSSEPLSPEDNYSSNASTPTTPCVNVTDENHDIPQHNQQQDTPEKSFKFPNKTGSLNDIASSSVDISRSNNASPETNSGYRSPSKTSFEARLQVDVDEPSCDRLNNLRATINGGSSPRTDPNCSPSPCHSTYASPTHSESVDLPDMFTRHLASPSGSSVSSFITSGLYKSNHAHTTLKKRWLLQYGKGRPVDKVPNGVITTNSFKTNLISRIAVSPRTFPLPYKRRKLMEYQKTVNNTTVDILPQAVTSENLAPAAPTVSSSVKTSPSMLSPMMSSVPMTSSVTSSPLSVSVTSPNHVTSLSTNNVRPTMLASSRTAASGVLNVTGSDDTVTGSEEVSWPRRASAGSDDTSVGRTSLSSISSTDDIKMDAVAGDTAKAELNLGNTVGSSSEVNRKPPLSTDTSLQAVQENSLESSTDCVTRGSEDTSRDKTVHVGSSAVAEGTVVSTTTPGGKKKVTLTEYLNRKRTTGSAVRKESAPGSSSDVTSASQSRVTVAGSLLSSSEPMSSVVNYRGSLGTSASSVTSGYGSTLLSTGVSSSTGGVMIEPVSPDEGYRVDDDRPSMHNAIPSARNPSTVEREAKPSTVFTSYRSSSQNHLPLSEPGSSSDAMDIDDDDVPSSSKIFLNTPVASLPGAKPVGVTSSDMRSSLAAKSYSNVGQPMKFNHVVSSQPHPGRQIPNSMVPSDNLGRPSVVPVSQIPNASIQPMPRHPDFRSTNSRPSPFY